MSVILDTYNLHSDYLKNHNWCERRFIHLEVIKDICMIGHSRCVTPEKLRVVVFRGDIEVNHGERLKRLVIRGELEGVTEIVHIEELATSARPPDAIPTGGPSP